MQDLSCQEVSCHQRAIWAGRTVGVFVRGRVIPVARTHVHLWATACEVSFCGLRVVYRLAHPCVCSVPMHVTNDVLLLLLTPIVVVVLVVIYAVQSAANRILRIESSGTSKQLGMFYSLFELLVNLTSFTKVQSSGNNREVNTILTTPARHLTVLINPCSGSSKENAFYKIYYFCLVYFFLFLFLFF
jgi:hypothetical protein